VTVCGVFFKSKGEESPPQGRPGRESGAIRRFGEAAAIPPARIHAGD
jgi:hypothetical protein